MDIIITRLIQGHNLTEKAINYFWTCWGNDRNFKFYEDCIVNSLKDENRLPGFYLALDSDKIAGTYALLTNDLISRQDLIPWFACLFVDPEYRKNGIAGRLLDHGLSQAKRMGYTQLYLSTDLNGFYERSAWTYLTDGFTVHGDKIKIYIKQVL